MATYIAGPTGAGIEDGSDWDNRLAGFNAVEDVPIAPGDWAYFGPGVYREVLTVDVSGGNAYVVGTVDVTNGSKQVDGNGTLWVANVATDYMFHISVSASGADGIANGTATFTSAGGNFQAAMIGQIIQINTRNSYKIGAVAAANSITLVDVNGVGWPGVGGGLTYSVMSGQGPRDVDSVDDNTTIQLKQAWSGPTLTVIAYITYNPIRYIGDVTGEHTDGVGGIVRITGSDNDQAAARASCISWTGEDYRTFRGFILDTCTGHVVSFSSVCTNNIIEDCTFQSSASNAIYMSGPCADNTIRRCLFLFTYVNSTGIIFTHSATVDDTSHLVENCILIGGANLIKSVRVGGITVRNCASYAAKVNAVQVGTALSVGQTVTVNNCILQGNNAAFNATVLGEIVEDFNTLFSNVTARINTAVGANSVTYPSLLLPPVLYSGVGQVSGFKFPWWFGELSKWSQIQAITGANEPTEDLRGIARPVTASKNSWGSCQFPDKEVESGTVQAGSYSRVLHDAGQVLARRIPVTGAEITVTLYVRREANYAGGLPQMVIKQPGQFDQISVMVAAVNTWEQLSDTFTPASSPGYVEVWVESRNTAVAGNYDIFYDSIGVA